MKDLFLELLPVLHNQGFIEKPFVNSEFGWHPGHGYVYNFARLCGKNLELLHVWIPQSSWYVINVYINILELSPVPTNIDELKNGTSFSGHNIAPAPTNTSFESLLYNNWWYTPQYGLKFRFTEWGRKRQRRQLLERMNRDFEKIDLVVARWHKKYTPIVVDWNGDPISSNSDKP